MGVDMSVNGYVKQPNGPQDTVWFEGDVALLEGQGVCYNWDYGTAADNDARRGKRVEIPTILNAPYFAGVLKCSYPARTGGQYIEIFLPGSICNVYTSVDTVVGVGRITAQAGAGGVGAGYFGDEGFPGIGSAVPLQTVTAGTGAVCMARLETGEQSGLVEYITAADGAIVCMVGGVTYFLAVTLGADATFVLADGVSQGVKKAFHTQGLQTTNNVVITVTSGVQLNGSTALATMTLDAITMYSVLEWGGIVAGATWKLIHNIGTVLA